MSKIKLGFSDMWGYEQYQFNPYNNYFTDLFSQKYEVEISDNPDVLIYSVFGNDFERYSCKKIFFNGENNNQGALINHYNAADIVLSHLDENDKNILLPLWVLFVNWFGKPQPLSLPSNPTYLVSLQSIQADRERFIGKRKFCAFINNNPIPDRIELFNELRLIDQVDSYGSIFNNVGKALRGSEKDKVKTLRDYKFTIAFENSYHSGYNTEKIIHPFAAGCVPIYKGGERVFDYFNEGSFLYCARNESSTEFVNRVFDILVDEDKWAKMVLSPPLKINRIMEDFAPQTVFEKIEKKF